MLPTRSYWLMGLLLPCTSGLNPVRTLSSPEVSLTASLSPRRGSDILYHAFRSSPHHFCTQTVRHAASFDASMADSASPTHSVHPSRVATVNHADAQSTSELSPGKGADVVKPEAASLSPGPALSSLRSSPANGLPAATHTASSGVPHQKKFTHSNINKKFLEKTNPSSTPSQTLSTSIVAKSGSSTRALSTFICLTCQLSDPIP